MSRRSTRPTRGIVRLVNQLIIEAFNRGASDIHVEPEGPKNPLRESGSAIDGDCQKFMENSPGQHRNAVVQRPEKSCRSSTSPSAASRRTAKIRFKYSRGTIELRVRHDSDGEPETKTWSCVSWPPRRPLTIDKMGLSANHNLERFKTILQKPYGICLVVGPTGSGKTTTPPLGPSAFNQYRGT